MALGLPSRLAHRGASLSELIGEEGRVFSFEFFPPKDDAGERQLWTAIRELERLRPTFVSVTYGAGGSTRDRTIRVTGRIAAETTLPPVAHLTCVGHSRSELRAIIGAHANSGVRNVLALRGDPPGGPSQVWERHPEGLDHATELVQMIKELGNFCVGVAAFPEGHPEATDLDQDARVLAAKARAGAEFAVTQFFFDADDYFRLVDRAAHHGSDMPVLPGIMPITSLRQITRMAELMGSAVPRHVVDRLMAVGEDPKVVRDIGIEVATELCDRLLAGGAPGLHFYTLNRSSATRRIYERLAVGIG